MNNSRLIGLIVIFSVAILTGLLIGLKTPLPEAVAMLSSPPVNMPATSQRNLLVIGVDDLTQAQPRLESIWLVIYFVDSARVTLLPVFPSATDTAYNRMLAESFSLDGNGQPGEGFWEVIEALAFWWNKSILIDQASSAEISHALQAEDSVDLFTRGVSTPGGIVSWSQDPQAALLGQRALFEAMCDSFQQAKSITTVQTTLLQIPGHLRPGAEDFPVLVDWFEMAARKDQLHCEFPTLENAQPR
jgi:hypothetical protein